MRNIVRQLRKEGEEEEDFNWKVILSPHVVYKGPLLCTLNFILLVVFWYCSGALHVYRPKNNFVLCLLKIHKLHTHPLVMTIKSCIYLFQMTITDSLHKLSNRVVSKENDLCFTNLADIKQIRNSSGQQITFFKCLHIDLKLLFPVLLGHLELLVNWLDPIYITYHHNIL